MDSNVDTSIAQNPGSQNNRLYYLDWLRIIIVMTVFFHHCARIFDLRSDQLFTAPKSVLLTLYREFNALWMMPLMFMIAGAAVFYSLNRRNPLDFIKERLLRILLPVLTIGLLLFYLENIYPIGDLGGHLWFLMFLILYTLLLLAFFVPMRKQRRSIFLRFFALFNKSWGLLLLFIPLAATAPLELHSNRVAGGWDFLPYLVFFVCGYMFFSNQSIQKTLTKYYIESLVAACILTAIYLYVEFSYFLPEVRAFMLTEYRTGLSAVEKTTLVPKLSVAVVVFFIVRHMAACCWVIGILGLGSRFLNFSNKFLVYTNEAVLPFYILHMTIMNTIAYFVNQRISNIAAIYIVVATSSFVVTMIVYELLVRRVNGLRILFGMKLKRLM